MATHEDVLALALNLPVGERLRLVEAIVTSIDQELVITLITPTSSWGRELMELVNSLALNAWGENETPEAWMRRYYAEKSKR